jgi:RNA polymerase sigma-70 factor, ECF subfamily
VTANAGHDDELARMMILGSGRAFDLLYLRHASAVRRLGVSMLRSPDAADDLVQETFLQLWRNRARYVAERAAVRTWVLAIARNRAIDMARAQARHARRVEAAKELARIADASSDPLTEALSRDEVSRLRAALSRLPSAQRRTLVLAYGGGLTHEQVAQRTGVPVGTVKSRLFFGRQTIARHLEPRRGLQMSSAA